MSSFLGCSVALIAHASDRGGNADERKELWEEEEKEKEEEEEEQPPIEQPLPVEVEAGHTDSTPLWLATLVHEHYSRARQTHADGPPKSSKGRAKKAKAKTRAEHRSSK